MSVAESTWQQNRRGEGSLQGVEVILLVPQPAPAGGWAPFTLRTARPVSAPPSSVPARGGRLVPHAQRRRRRPALREALV